MNPSNPTSPSARIDPDELTPARIWSELDADTRALAARAVYDKSWDDGSARKSANRAIAAAIRFRPVAVQQLPIERRVGYLVQTVQPDEGLAHTLLMALHLVERSALLARFLDTLGVPQSGGLIDESHELEPPEGPRLAAAVAAVREHFPADQVELYLACLVAMDPETWEGVTAYLRGDA